VLFSVSVKWMFSGLAVNIYSVRVIFTPAEMWLKTKRVREIKDLGNQHKITLLFLLLIADLQHFLLLH
jgi:hypothetical protein